MRARPFLYVGFVLCFCAFSAMTAAAAAPVPAGFRERQRQKPSPVFHVLMKEHGAFSGFPGSGRYFGTEHSMDCCLCAASGNTEKPSVSVPAALSGQGAVRNVPAGQPVPDLPVAGLSMLPASGASQRDILPLFA